MMRTRKRRAPRMRQKTQGREKMPEREFEAGLVPKENRKEGWRRSWAEKPSVPEFPGAPNNGVPVSDTNTVTVILQTSLLRQANLTPASVAPRQSQGLSGRCPAKTASEDLAHPLSLGFRRQSIKQSWDLHLTNEEQHSGAGGRTLNSATWEPDPLGPWA